MWFGTQAGLNQYDGYTFKIYQNNPLDSLSISDDNINSVVEDSTGSLWIGTNSGGLHRLDQYQNRFEQYRADENDSTALLNNSVICLYVDRRDRLWVGTVTGISLYNKETDSFLNFLSGSYIKAIFEDSEGFLWIGTGFDGLYKYDYNQNRFKRYMHDLSDPNSIGSNDIETIVQDNRKRIWIGTMDGGLNLYDRRDDNFIVYRYDPDDKNSIPGNTIYTLLIDRGGHLWAGFENAGLSRFEINDLKKPFPSHLIFTTYRHEPSRINSLGNNTVRSLFEDKQGNLWIGTFSGGINLLCRNRKQFENYHTEPFNTQGLSHDIVQAFLEDRSGHVWIGTDGGGLNVFNPARGGFKKYTHDPGNPYSICSNHVLDICKDDDGNLWLATWDGLNYFNISRNEFIRYENKEGHIKSLTSSKVTSVLEDTGKNLWIGTISGLNIYNRKENLFFHSFEGVAQDIGSKYIQCLYEDRSGNIWVGTVWGLYQLHHEDLVKKNYKFQYYLHDSEDTTSLSDNHIFSIVEDRQGLIWVTTLSGLNCYHTDRNVFQSYTIRDGLASNWILSIVEDNQGSLWMGTHEGISKFDPVTKRFANFDIHDGLLSSEFTKGVMRSFTGELYFGGKTGFSIFHPDSIKQSSFIPPVVLTDFQVFNRSVMIAPIKQIQNSESNVGSIELSYKQNMFSFEFAALDYTAPEKNRYQYKLEGFDRDWRVTDASRRFATYTNLPGGKYVFRVKGSNSDGLWNEEGLFISVSIQPPFWKTNWALLIYIGVTFAVLMLMRELIVYRERLKNEMLMDRKEAERIHELDELKLRFFTNISHEFRTPLSLIIGVLDRLLRSKGHFKRKVLFQNYHVMFRNAKRLLRLINQIMDIRKLDEGRMRLELKQRDIIYFIKSIYSSFKFQAEQRSIHCQFESEVEQLYIWFDPDKIEKIIYNVLSNAFKFTKNGGIIRIQMKVLRNQNSTPVLTAADQRERMEISSQFRNYLEIQIQDNGIGIPDKYLDRIYDPFFQIENKENPLSKGTGVGLALTRELINLHQGSVSVQSREGSGSCFIIRLPLDLAPENVNEGENSSVENEAVPSIPDDEAIITDSIAKHDMDKSVPLVLIADDDMDFCNYLRDELYEDYRVIEASDGEEAYKMTIEFIPDLIVSDIKMPKMNGFVLCSKIKQNVQTSHIPVILLTSQTADKNRTDGYDFGADDYIEKPFDIYLLRTRIANLIQTRNKLKEKFSHEIYLQPKNVPVTPEDERFLNHVIQIVDEHIEDSEFHVSRLGNEIGLGRVQLYRKIKALTDSTPNDLIRTLRLKRAAQLLETSKLTVFEITYRVGFKDPSYFCKCFRNQYGSSPAEYARIHQIQLNEEKSSNLSSIDNV